MKEEVIYNVILHYHKTFEANQTANKYIFQNVNELK